jgi:hypothetical protein
VTSSLTFSPRELTELYAHKAYDELSQRFLDILRHFAESKYSDIDPPTQRAVDAFVLTFLHLFSQADYLPRRDHGIEFIERNGTISNLVALSALKTTDPYLEVVRHQDNGLIKILALYSARNSVSFDRERIFALDPELAAIWYVAYAAIFHGGLVRSDVCKNLQAHYAFQPDTFRSSDRIPDICYGVSYVDGHSERSIKPAVNRWICSVLSGTKVRNTPNPRKIAVLSCLWWHGQSSYRTGSAYVETLRDYDLTLFYVPMPGKNVDTTYFREVKELTFTNGVLDIGPLLDNDFQIAFFPDIGMTSFSIWLANLRIAPIQVVSTGHSVSTWAGEIDYYLSGADVETPEHPEQYYSERLVLLPGCGVIHPVPAYEPLGRSKTVPEFVLNCPWTPQKIHHEFCRTLAQIVERSARKLRLRLFVGGTGGELNVVPLTRELTRLLPGAVIEVLPDLSYQNYMALMEEGDLSIDTYHFGSCNGVADSLYVRKLMVSCAGERWYNRIGPQMLRMAGLPELVATSPEKYVDQILGLIHDDDYRHRLEQRLKQADLERSVFSRADAKYFRKAIDYLIANHKMLQRDESRSPIRIVRDPE